jgi:hypothetical protein
MMKKKNNFLNRKEILLRCFIELGAEYQFVNIEDVYELAFKTAPHEFSWDSKPHISDYKLKMTTKHLQEEHGKEFFKIKNNFKEYQFGSEALKFVKENQEFKNKITQSRSLKNNSTNKEIVIQLEENYKHYFSNELSQDVFLNSIRLSSTTPFERVKEKVQTLINIAENLDLHNALIILNKGLAFYDE